MVSDVVLVRAKVQRTTRKVVLGPAGLSVVVLEEATRAAGPDSPYREAWSPLFRITAVRFPRAGLGSENLELLAGPARSPYDGVVRCFVVAHGPEVRGTFFPYGLQINVPGATFSGLAQIGLAGGARIALHTVGVPRARIESVLGLDHHQRVRELFVLNPRLTSAQVRFVEAALWSGN